MKNLKNYEVQELDIKEVENIYGGWSFLMPWKLGYLFVEYGDELDKPAIGPTLV